MFSKDAHQTFASYHAHLCKTFSFYICVVFCEVFFYVSVSFTAHGWSGPLMWGLICSVFSYLLYQDWFAMSSFGWHESVLMVTTNKVRLTLCSCRKSGIISCCVVLISSTVEIHHEALKEFCWSVQFLSPSTWGETKQDGRSPYVAPWGSHGPVPLLHCTTTSIQNELGKKKENCYILCAALLSLWGKLSNLNCAAVAALTVCNAIVCLLDCVSDETNYCTMALSLSLHTR